MPSASTNEPADKSFAETDDFADNFQRHHRAKDAGQGAEHTRLGTSRHRRLWRRGRIKTTVSWIGFAEGTIFMWPQNRHDGHNGLFSIRAVVVKPATLNLARLAANCVILKE